MRRALIERPVVYAAELTDSERVQLATDQVVAEVELLTGLRAERRAEGVALIDTSGRFSDIRFPGTGTLAQVALLLVGEIADLVLDIDNPVERRPRPAPSAALAAALDEAIPESTVFAPLVVSLDPNADEDDSPDLGDSREPGGPQEDPQYPVVAMSWIRDTVAALTDRYGSTFAAQWQADVPGLTREVLALLERLRLVEPITLDATGIRTRTGEIDTLAAARDTPPQSAVTPSRSEPALLILPALARYRGAIVTVRTRAESELFASATKLGDHAMGGGPQDYSAQKGT